MLLLFQSRAYLGLKYVLILQKTVRSLEVRGLFFLLADLVDNVHADYRTPDPKRSSQFGSFNNV